jgi:hypothetical protein
LFLGDDGADGVRFVASLCIVRLDIYFVIFFVFLNLCDLTKVCDEKMVEQAGTNLWSVVSILSNRTGGI